MTKDEFCTRAQEYVRDERWRLIAEMDNGEDEKEISPEDEVVIKFTRLIGEVNAKDSEPNGAKNQTN